jgi:hypothetical protein
VVAERDRRRRVVAVEHGQRPACGGHPRRLGQRRAGVGDVRQHGVEDDGIERAVVEGQRRPAALHVGQVAHARGDPPRALDEHRRRIEPHDLADAGARGDRPCHGTRAAADLEYARALAQRQLGQVVVEHRLLGRLRRAQLEHLGEALLHGLVGGLDAGVDVGHGPRRA